MYRYCKSLEPASMPVMTIEEFVEKDIETEAVLVRYNIDARPFSCQVLSCLPPLPWSVSSQDLSNPNRQDLRHLCTFSVDPPECKDIDDALHCTALPNGNFEVGVHIADVSHFVHPGTALDHEAARRGNSVHLVRRRIDMLPRLLTEDVCSLRPDVERLTFSVIWEMTPEAEIISTKYTKGVIKSRAALSYEEVQDRMDDIQMVDPITESLREMNVLAKILRQKRMDRGALIIDCETNDSLDIGSDQKEEANQVVEEFMLAANVSVAEKIMKHFPQCSLLLWHPTPTKDRLEPLLRTAAVAGLSLDVTSSKALAESLNRAMGDDPDFNELIRSLAIRCMTHAVYFWSGDLNPSEFYHYGLAAPLYTHFTSPIRRYADLIVHRLLEASLGINRLADAFQDRAWLVYIANNLNYRRKNAKKARRPSVELYAHYLLQILGEEC